MDPTAIGREPTSSAHLPARIGRYDVRARIGTGAGSEVLLARAAGEGEDVVLKRVRADRASIATYARQLEREALVHARLAHANVVRLLDRFDDDGRVVLVLEHVEGPSLRQLATWLRARKERLDDAGACCVVADLLSALAAAHATAIIHRDVSPGNVLLTWDGSVRLADFGIAHMTAVDAFAADAGMQGTPGYMAPEQILGPFESARTDVYAAALVLRDLLLGAQSFPRSDQGDHERMRAMAFPSLSPIDALRPELPRDLCAAISLALQPDPAARTISAAGMRAVLARSADLTKGRARLRDALAAMRATVPALRDARFSSVPSLPRVAVDPPPLPSIVPAVELRPRPPSAPPARARAWTAAIGALAAATGVALLLAWVGARALAGASVAPRLGAQPPATAADAGIPDAQR